MSNVLLDMAISLDGYINGPDDSDIGLYDWYFAPEGRAVDIISELLASIGAMIIGRRAYGEDFNGFDTPYKIPHFVVTHTARPSVERDGATFHFVTDGIVSALDQARAAAGDRLVCVAGGANTAQQFFRAGLIDELQLHLVPILANAGTRLFAEGGAPIRLERTRVVESPGATHVRYRVLR